MEGRKALVAMRANRVYLCLLMTGFSNAAEPMDVYIKNELSNCIEITDSKVLHEKGIPLLNIRFKKKLSISECGCKSMLSTYTAHIKLDGYESSSMPGNPIFSNKDVVNFPIATGELIVGDSSLSVRISCAAPD